jgi:hypothetical protein
MLLLSLLLLASLLLLPFLLFQAFMMLLQASFLLLLAFHTVGGILAVSRIPAVSGIFTVARVPAVGAPTLYTVHRKKKVRKFPVPSRDVTTKLSLGGNNDVITELFLPRGSLVWSFHTVK